MKKSHLLSLLLLLLICACNNAEDSKSISEKGSNTTAEKTKSSQVKDGSKEKSGIQKKLVETKPLSENQIQQWFPETLLNLTKTSSQKGTLLAPDAHGASGMYVGNDNQKFSISITDCAGTGAEKIYKNYADYKKQKNDHENSTSITTYFNKDGRSGKTLFVKSLNMYNLDFLYKDRLAVTINAQNMEQENVYKVIDAIPFDDLIKQ